jgi:hypothetical protein
MWWVVFSSALQEATKDEDDEAAAYAHAIT